MIGAMGPVFTYITLDGTRNLRILPADESLDTERVRLLQIDLHGNPGQVKSFPTNEKLVYSITTTDNKGGGADPITNQAPAVTLTSPSNQAEYDSNSDIRLRASASDIDGQIVKVEFYQGNSLIGSDTDENDGWSVVWENVAEGDYTLSAVAYDDDNAQTTSRNVNISVGTVQSTANEGENPFPTDFALLQNFPNPFNSVTTLSIAVPEPSTVEVSVYDVSGKMITTLLNDTVSVGTHQLMWDSTGLSSGVYLIKMQTQDGVFYRQATVLR